MGFLFWCNLPDGRACSITETNLFDAPRRARELGAVTCFCKNPSTGKTMQLSMY
jgi:hypothetical protein